MTRRLNPWPWVPVGLLTVMVGGVSTMAVIASNDPGFALERDYYQKAVDWDAHQVGVAQNARLGWSFQLETRSVDRRLEIVAVLHDRSGNSIDDASVQVEAFPNARANDISELQLDATRAGTHRGTVPLSRYGLWEFRLRAERGTERFTQVIRRDVRRGDTS